jgi:CIC family chloride channel protein
MVRPSAAAARIRILSSRAMAAIGFREDSFLLVLAAIVGVITAAGAVGFHELINWIRDLLYGRMDPEFLYRVGSPLLILWPAIGGLVVGYITHHVARQREGKGVVDVLESVMRSSGFIAPSAAIEKTITSAITIGSGGSCGAEGPIVQIGAAIASGVGQLFRIARAQMPLIIGCGTAAGISAVFNSPMGGLLFTLEVILLDFSLRTITPVIIASVIANVSTQATFRLLHEIWPAHYHSDRLAIFSMPDLKFVINWPQMANFIVLGVACGLIAVTFTRVMSVSERRFAQLRTAPALRPALGGALLGSIGIVYIIIFGWLALNQAKPILHEYYPMPAFFGDGYGFTQQLFRAEFYDGTKWTLKYIVCLLAFLTLAKIIGTALTIGSGGSGGIIAPALFLGATTGGLIGIVIRQIGWFADLQPNVYALVGMGAVLAAVVHAPLAAILILMDLTGNYQLALPVMLASIVATGIARRIFPESIYTAALRERGVHLGGAADHSILRRLHVEHVALEPAATVSPIDPFQRALDLSSQLHTSNFAVLDRQGYYAGMLVESDINLTLLQREAVPLLTVGELARNDIPLVRNSDDLASVLDTFSRHDVDYLPVCLEQAPGKVIGLISRAGLMRAYHKKLAE